MTWIDVLTLIGAIGLFLYGLRLMSEGLQKAAGDSLRKALSAMRSNRFAAMLMGVLITVAEPDLSVLADQVKNAVEPVLLIVTVGVGRHHGSECWHDADDVDHCTVQF